MTTAVKLNPTNECNDLRIENLAAEFPCTAMLRLQQNLQERLQTPMDPTENLHKISQRVIFWRHCLQDELSEVHDWVPFTSEAMLKEAKMEIIDAWHFMNNIALELGVTGEEIDAELVSHIPVRNRTILEHEASVSTALRRLFDTLPWKTWKTYSEASLAAHQAQRTFAKPLTQVFLTLLQYAAFFEMDLAEVHSYYAAKHLENHARQDRGY